MLHINNISKQFGSRRVLDGVSFTMNAGEIAGVVGANGAGKTTLLQIVAGEVAADGGAIETQPHSRVGYLRQGYAPVAASHVSDVFPARFAQDSVERELAALGARLASSPNATIEAQYNDALARLSAAPPDDQAKALARDLRLRDIAQDERVGSLSGGEQTKLGLIELTVSRPDVLLLDEPTNNLDFQGMAWLDAFLERFPGPVLIVSHDRALLDDHASQIIEIDAASGRASIFAGAYSDYAAEKQRRQDAAWQGYRRQTENDRRMEREIRAIKATAQHREKLSQNDFYRRKAKKVARRAVVLEKRLRREQSSTDRVEKPIARPYGIKPEMSAGGRSGDRMISVRNLIVAIEGRELLRVDEFAIGWGERIAIAGANGSGKTTLLRTLLGEIPTANVATSPSARIGYLPQVSALAADDDRRTPVEILRRANAMSETESRRFLHRFLFSGDDVFTPIARLSYGEQRRLALAQLVLSGANLLMLDEPTNHLDIPSREAFEAALESYDGAILAVTHDRYFVERIANRMLIVEDGTLRED